ncbi:hypothetical protein [Mycolicibacterium sarraceniae]|uniref:Uncharacterized protein n=1 Tax=Mycolicibacterium sarraceniae TaxID=1534348 RepID=A0A7I7SP16_9MYCO|nr:hypothetical protein [Mycolicibacterium sarraceniae]BBY57586.1 hypothetical protein MSAR_07220 [Mycolicibacterium sarraceniae]
MVPPTSAGSGGGSGVVDVGVVLVDVAVLDDVGADVVGADDEEVVDACDWGPWKSTHASVRTVLPPELTTSEPELTV